MSNYTPKLWLIILIAGLPILCETIYTPALPDIAHNLQVQDAWVEYTLSIYLFGFALGTLFWGKLSDRYGRKKCMLAGYAIFTLGCVGCYFSSTIGLLLMSRLLQACGGAVGSVLGQAITRDSFQGKELAQAFSAVAGTLAMAPAIGPVVGGLIDQCFGWKAIFVMAILFSACVWQITYFKLQETYKPTPGRKISSKAILQRLAKDPKVLALGFLVAGCNGIIFGYFAEGPFYMIELLGLSPAVYGATFVGTALAGLFGGYISRRLQSRFDSVAIMRGGVLLTLASSLLFLLAILLLYTASVSVTAIAIVTISCMMGINLGLYAIIPNSLSLALKEYRDCIGTASSLFGFYYYILISLFSYGMGALHNGTLFVMPAYFFAIGFAMFIVYEKWICKAELHYNVSFKENL